MNPLQLDDTIKKQIITTLLTVLDFNMYEAEIVCNIYFIFQYFNVPQDFVSMNLLVKMNVVSLKDF